jgi:hypothetical protein
MPQIPDDWEDESLLPTVTPPAGAASSSTEPAQESASGQPEEATLLPSKAGAGLPSAEAVPPQAAPSADSGLLPSQSYPESGTPHEAQGHPGSGMESAFDFSDFDLPSIDATVNPEAAAAVEATHQVSAAAPEPAPVADEPISFSFSDSLPPAPAAAPAQTPAPTPAPPSEEPAPFDFTLDEPPAAAAPAPVPAPAEPQPVAPPLDTDTFVVDDSGTGEVEINPDDFDLDSLLAEPAPHDVAATSEMSAPGPEILDDADAWAGGFTDSAIDEMGDIGVGLSDDEVAANMDPMHLYHAISPVLEELVNEVRRSLEFHLSRYPDSTISSITLLGGGARLLNLDAYFTQMLGIPTQVANPFAQLAINAPKLPPEYAHDNAPLCTVALGLALRDFVA